MKRTSIVEFASVSIYAHMCRMMKFEMFLLEFAICFFERFFFGIDRNPHIHSFFCRKRLIWIEKKNSINGCHFIIYVNRCESITQLGQQFP